MRLPNRRFSSVQCTWYFNSGVDSRSLQSEELSWNIQPVSDVVGPFNGVRDQVSLIEVETPEQEFALRPELLSDLSDF